MKKLLSLTLALVLALSLCAPALAEEAGAPVDGDSADSYRPGGVHTISLEDGYYEVDVDELETLDPDYIGDSLWTDWTWEEEEPTYTLVVNGQPTGVELTVTGWATYADGAALGALLGTDVGEGPVAVRSAAEAAGWDVVWYGGGWRGVDQEICLYNKDICTAGLDETFGPAQEFLGKLLGQSMDLFWSETPQKITETVELDLTRFSSLDGDRTAKAKVRLEATCCGGVADYVASFDLWEVLRLFDVEKALENSDADFTLDDLKALAQGGRAECILDLNAGEMAWRAPILGLLDPDLAGWQWQSLELEDAKDQLTAGLDIGGLLYQQLLSDARYMGSAYAQKEQDKLMPVLETLLGADCFQSRRGETSYTLTTGRMNAAFSRWLEEESGKAADLFKSFEVSVTLDERGGVTSRMDLRPDVTALAAAGDDFGVRFLLGAVLPLLDMHLTASSSSAGLTGTETMELHWNNQGRLRLFAEAAGAAAQTMPRQVADVAEPVDDAILLPVDSPVTILSRLPA